MADYTGVKCIVCKEKFKDGDDIVVCPDCGTPYHRDCYNNEGKCINTDLHENGGSFNSITKQTEEIGEKRHCPRCGALNEPLTLFCAKCGMPMSMPEQQGLNDNIKKGAEQSTEQQPTFLDNPFNIQAFQVNFSDPLCGLNPEETYDNVQLAELADFIGPNTFYYLPIFKRIKDTAHIMSWNFSAMLAPTIYYAYRKMYLFMILSLVIKILIYIPSLIVMLASGNLGYTFLTDLAKSFDLKSSYFEFASNVAYFFSYVLMFATGAFSNWVYYRHSINKIMKIKKSKSADKPVREIIKSKGGVSRLNLILLLCLPVVVGIITFFLTVIYAMLK